MRRAIKVHRQDFLAVAALLVAALAVVAYVLRHQPSFTFGKSYYTVHARFSTGAAITSGQGQAVTIAGVQVGQIGGISLKDGQADVTMNLYKKYRPIYRDATVLLRPRTPLKDMYLALDPGTRSAGAVPAGGTLPASSTAADVDVDQILSSLDTDTRNYLLLLLSGGAQIFQDTPGASAGVGGTQSTAPSPRAVDDLRGTFKRFAPLNRDTARFTRLLAQRQRNITRAVHNLQLVAGSLGSVETQFTSLIRASNTNFGAISSQDANLRTALTLLPPTLQTTTQTLAKVQGFATQSGTTLNALLPFAHALGPALQAAQPLLRDTTPVIRDELRPFTTAVTPLANTLNAGSVKLSKATPDLTRSIAVLNSLLNTLAFEPRGKEQGYLFWGSWLAHIADSLTSTQDSHGAIVRSLFMGTCPELQLLEVTIEKGSPSLGPILDLLNAPDWSKINSPFCPTALGF
jgi:phospholipid/cholesterol/gamma-HCH transport system substrate-binding protein